MKTRSMAFIKFTVSAVLLAFAGFWVIETKRPFNSLAYSILGAMIFFAGYALYQGIIALKNEKAGLTSIDELSKKISEKAAAKAFVFSIYMWLFALLFVIDWLPFHDNNVITAIKIMVALGMMGMTLIFIFARIYYSRVGIGDENKD